MRFSKQIIVVLIYFCFPLNLTLSQDPPASMQRQQIDTQIIVVNKKRLEGQAANPVKQKEVSPSKELEQSKPIDPSSQYQAQQIAGYQKQIIQALDQVEEQKKAFTDLVGERDANVLQLKENMEQLKQSDDRINDLQAQLDLKNKSLIDLNDQLSKLRQSEKDNQVISDQKNEIISTFQQKIKDIQSEKEKEVDALADKVKDDEDKLKEKENRLIKIKEELDHLSQLATVQ